MRSTPPRRGVPCARVGPANASAPNAAPLRMSWRRSSSREAGMVGLLWRISVVRVGQVVPDGARERLDITDRRELVGGVDAAVRPPEAAKQDFTPPCGLDEAHIGARRGAPAPEFSRGEAEALRERALPARPMRAAVRLDDRREMAGHL